MTIEDRLKEDLLDIAEQTAKYHYYPARFIQMVHGQGAVATAKALLGDSHIQSGLIRLWDLRRLDISLEATILKPEYRDLFTTEEIRSARERLEKLDWNTTKRP